ncbi:MAG: dynamin family protein [Lamprobacter sp.]|uniref:dynamin family protein n=1 Tax=Lamprobacter sp. TaxID=3100796 RepID=UPI002B263327|nr:dynamin family protein [Lamprobacter sp.]MEA3643160.1 dynamin family protein [Lamprobacter sp.]
MSAQFKQRSELLTIYRELHDQPGPLIDEAARAELQTQAQRLLNEAFQIAFIGRFSAGKSMLINRLFLMTDVLTVALKPTTARLMYIRYGEQPALWLVKAEGENLKRLPLAAPGSTVEDIAAAIKQHTTHLGAVEYEETGAYQLDWPDGHFFKDGVQLVDSIGTEDIDDQFVNATYTAIRQSDAVVMVLTMTQPLTESEQRFIDEHIGNTGKKFFLVVNKADARNREEQQEVLDDLRQRFIRLYQNSHISAEERIFAVSAKDGQGLEDLRERLLHFVAEERLDEIVRYHQTVLIQHLDGWLLICRQRLKEIQAKKDGNESQLRIAREQLRELGEELVRQRDSTTTMQEELHDELKVEVRNILEQGQQKLRDLRLVKLSVDNIRIELADFFRDQCERLSGKLQRHASELLQRRISLLAGINPENLEQLTNLNSDNSRQMLIKTGMVTGGVAALAGGGALIGAVQVATATQISLWGSLVAGQSGLAVFASALAPWAIPAVAGGIAIAYSAKKAAEQQKAKDHEAFLIEAQNKIRLDCKILERELGNQLDEYISQVWQQIEKEVEDKGKKLELLIAQTDLITLDTDINSLRCEEQRLSTLRGRLVPPR